jgi:hypothetical protein
MLATFFARFEGARRGSARRQARMFELGMRLAFDKPTIIVKDNKTTYSFDTSPIEHLSYPRDLRFSKIVEFKEKLSDKIKATHVKATADATYNQPVLLPFFRRDQLAELVARGEDTHVA